MSPAFVPTLKEVTRHLTVATTREIAERVLHMKTVGEVRGYLTRKVRMICPNVAMLDVRR
jgi:hypothetical protein